MSDVHTYIPGDNGCAARVRSTDMWGGRSSTTSVQCGAPETSPYHWRTQPPRNSGESVDPLDLPPGWADEHL